MKIELRRGRIPITNLNMIDITVKSARTEYKCFAPTWDLVMSSKRKQITKAQYKERFIKLLNTRNLDCAITNLQQTYITNHSKPIYLCCYCSLDRWCHTDMVIDYLIEKYPNLFCRESQ